MRPDYTLSLWPEGFSKEEAETQEIIVHIHFDAKYRVDSLGDILGNDEPDLDREKEDQRSGTYKRADLLKMHAYKDAIRRTGGAYVLYLGNDNTAAMKGFHEIIPGLGAFAVRPSRNDDGTEYLKAFINKVVNHLLDRSSQRDRLSYRTYDIYKGKNDFEVHESMPEHYAGVRALPPEDTVVLIGYCKSDEHYTWIHKEGLYNFRVTGRGELRRHVDPKQLSADYLLLHKKGQLITGDIRKIIKPEFKY